MTPADWTELVVLALLWAVTLRAVARVQELSRQAEGREGSRRCVRRVR